MESNIQKREVNSVRKALNILDYIYVAQDEVPLAAICSALSLNRATAYQLLTTLCACGYVHQKRSSRNYVLGSKPFMMSRSNAFLNHLIAETRPTLNEIAKITSETVHLAIRNATEMVFLDKVESLYNLRAITDLSQKTPIHCCSVGKALMAYLPEAELQQILEFIHWERYTDTTIMDEGALRKQLQTVREVGYSVDDQEYFSGVRCVAVPIMNQFQFPICAIGISAPVQRVPDFSVMGNMLLEHKQKLEAQLFFSSQV